MASQCMPLVQKGPKERNVSIAKYLADQELQWGWESKEGTGQVAQNWTELPATTGDIFSLNQASSTQKKAHKICQKGVSACLCVCVRVRSWIIPFSFSVVYTWWAFFASKFARKQNISNISSSPRFLTETWPHISMLHVVRLMVKVAATQATTAQLTM